MKGQFFVHKNLFRHCYVITSKLNLYNETNKNQIKFIINIYVLIYIRKINIHYLLIVYT